VGRQSSPLKPINNLKTRRERDVYAALYMLLVSGVLRPSHIEVRYSRPITHEALGRQHSLRPGRILHSVPAQVSHRIKKDALGHAKNIVPSQHPTPGGFPYKRFA
jgi:hypothetical protein